MNSLLEQLQDIDGLDTISSWPLAIGWWVAIAVAIAALILLIFGLGYWISFKRSWKYDTLRKLTLLEENLSEATSRETAVALSEYVRRIALRRFNRKACASLIGESWLAWLAEHDPKQFDWKAKGALLINVPYAPENSTMSIEQVKDLIQAVKNWVR